VKLCDAERLLARHFGLYLNYSDSDFNFLEVDRYC